MTLSRLMNYFLKNPVNILYTGLLVVVLLLTYENSFSKKKQLTSHFSGKIEFGQTSAHQLITSQASAEFSMEGGQRVLTLKITEPKSFESVFIKLFNVNGTGTYFIPGDGKNSNIGNLIKNLNNYNDKNNFYVASLPNSDGVFNGVGRINITNISDEFVEGDLILVTNNPQGEQAVLESAKFSISIN